jgi:hypothetical protein
MAKRGRRPKPGKRHETNDDRKAIDVREAIGQKRFQPWHAAAMLDAAETAADFDRAVQEITALVGRGQERRSDDY